MIPLRGVSYALQLLSPESKEDLVALKGSLSLMCQVIQQSGGSFQNLHSMKTHLQQISIYLMEHLVSRVWLSSLKGWSELETVSAEVLASFFLLMEEGETELETSGGMMQLLDEHLPSHIDEFGWDVPLIACLADALSLTAQLGPIISALVRQSVLFKKEKFARSSEQALRMLEDAFRRVLEVLQLRDFKASQSFVALALARELIVHCVTLVEAAMEDEDSEQRFDNILDHFVQLLQVSFVPQEADLDSQTELGHFKDQNLKVDSFPTAFTPLYVVAATRRSRNPLPTNIAIGQLGAVAMKAPGSDLHRLLGSCKAEAVAFSNILGLSMLVPVQTDPATVPLFKCLKEVGSEDEALSKHAAERFSRLCGEKRNNFRDLLQCLRAVGEFVCMQCSAEDEQTMQRACKTAHDLPNSLGPAATLLCLAADDNIDWNVDLLSMDGERAWQTSIMAHLLCFLGAAHKSINKENLPPAIRPFAVFHDLDKSSLNSTFWPGVPDDWWQALRYSGLHTHLLPISGNIVWAQCQCGYRYCYAQCGAPASSAPCASPEGR